MFLHEQRPADLIETKVQQFDHKFAALKADYDQINDTTTAEKQNEITDLVNYIIDESNPFQDIGTQDIWIDDDIFDDKDIVDVFKAPKSIYFSKIFCSYCSKVYKICFNPSSWFQRLVYWLKSY